MSLADDYGVSHDAMMAAAGDQPLTPAAQPKARPAIHSHLTAAQLADIGTRAVADWRRDLTDNKEWREKAQQAEDVAAQVEDEAKTYPFARASNVKYPLLTIAAMAFHARAYPGIVKGDEAVKVKTFGKTTDAKRQRATRLADYLNYLLFYKIEGWEEDTDSLLLRLPIVGQHFRKVYFDPLERRTCIESISALRLTIPPSAPSLARSPRITHDFDRYPHELQALMRTGDYRKVDLLVTSEDEQAPRVILEQHRLIDLDKDGLEEPYIVTVDVETMEVLRVEEGFEDEGVTENAAGEIVRIERWGPFVSYSFIPDMKGRAYGIGFGHLLTAIMDVVNTNINLMIDAGHAAVAGGGFISAEVRLQGAGKSSKLTWQPGEYKTVNASASDIRNAIWERTLPQPSDVLFQLLGMLMEAAKDIASVNEAITGDASRNAPVGTTLALIEQGQQVFNAIYKRIYRALRQEFRLLADCQKRYGDPAEYAKFCDTDTASMGHNGGPPMNAAAPEGWGPSSAQDGVPPTGMMQQAEPAPAPVDPAQLFAEDFDDSDLDVRPISDPTAITQMQRMARAQFALSLVPTGEVSPKAAVRRALEAAGEDGIDELMSVQQVGMSPVQLQMLALEAHFKEAQTKKTLADAQLSTAKAADIVNANTGAQADLDIAERAAEIHDKQMKAFTDAAGAMGPGLGAPQGEQQ